MNLIEDHYCRVCGKAVHYDIANGQYYDSNDQLIDEPGAWCHWCDSGYICNENIRYVNDDGHLPKSCCTYCYAKERWRLPQTRYTYNYCNYRQNNNGNQYNSDKPTEVI